MGMCAERAYKATGEKQRYIHVIIFQVYVKIYEWDAIREYRQEPEE